MIKRSGSSEKGFSLLELLIAVMILASSLVLIFQLFSEGLRGGVLSDNYRTALLHARNKMEEIRLFERMESVQLTDRIDDVFSIVTTVEQKKDDRDDQQLRDADQPRIFEITVDVYWKEGMVKKSVEVSTLTLARRVKPLT